MKKKITKWTIRVISAIVIPVFLILVYAQFSYKPEFEVPQTGIVASGDSAIIARGEYLVMGPGHCWNCHAPDGESNLRTGTKVGMSGGAKIELPFGYLHAPNLTSDTLTGIGGLSDEMIARAIRYGVRHDNTALIPFMSYNGMSDEDIRAVISYLRNIPPIRNNVPEKQLNILGKVVNRFLIKPVMPETPIPKVIPRDTSAAYGQYLAMSVGNCVGCHTNRDKKSGAFVGPKFAGGYEMNTKSGVFSTPNLTPDQETGRIVSWTVNDFVKRFRTGALYPDTPMPWKSFGALSDNDLKAFYYFFQSLEPVKNNAPVFTPHKRENGN